MTNSVPRAILIVIAASGFVGSKSAAGDTSITQNSQERLTQERCEALRSIHLPGVEIKSSTWVPPGSFVGSMPTISGTATFELAAHCEIKATARPTSDSEIGIEVWLPAANWNGKYQQIGNGGWAGAIHRRPLVTALRRGYAAAVTDGGHQGGLSDEGQGRRSAEFAIGHPEKLIDFGYRALTETRTVALAAIKTFYGKAATWKYFVGCSDGGREALMIAQRFPEEFDGILAGNPGNAWSRWAAGLVWNQQAQLAGTEGAIPTTKRSLIHAAVIRACDAVDGVRDGLISDPRFCKFDPVVLQCRAGDSPDCLTAPQIATLQKIYAGPRNPRTGEKIFSGFPAGSETGSGSIITPAQPGAFSFGDTYFGQALFERDDWDFRSLDFDRDIAFSDRKGAPVLVATNPDLRSFRAHSGRLIQYHGWSDPLMPAGGSIDYYEDVRAFMESYPDPRSSGSGSIDDFYRLFLIPGMGHCYGGDGPTAVMPVGSENALDPKYDLMLSLEQWVENGLPPNIIIGSGRVPNDLNKKMSRPICPYPQVARYKGAGDTNDAASFTCSAKLSQ